MASLAQLEEQIVALNALNRSSAKTLDTFADTSNAISVRARQITRDVKPWEVAQENIALTIEEMAKAARCYHPPPSLGAVLARREKTPATVARCIDYLVYTDDYLSSHPPNDYGEDIHAKAEAQLRQIVLISEDMIKTSFLRALEKPPVSTAQGTADTPVVSATGGKGLIIRNPVALDGVGLVVQRLGENFNRTDVVRKDVRALLEGRLKALVEGLFDNAYREEELGKPQQTTHTGASSVVKHYQRGDHRLLGISRTARQAVSEVGDCVKEHILTPLDEDYAVAEIPSMLAAAVFDIITTRAFAVVRFDRTVFNDPTKVFMGAHGQGIGLYPADTRYFRDLIFVGLDLVEELWGWKALASALPGDHDNFIDYVDNGIERFVFEVRALLDGYVMCNGALEKALLKERTVSQHRSEWFPSVDCTAHESTTNSVFFHKVLLTSYYGALKVALYGNTLSPSAEGEATQEVEDYLIRCVLGTMQELRTIAEAAVELQEEVGHVGRRRVGGTRGGVVPLLGGGDGTRLSPPIFLLNNAIFLEDNYRREKCFLQRTVTVSPGEHAVASPVTVRRSRGADATVASSSPAAKDGGEKGGRAARGPLSVPVVTHILSILADEKEQCIDDFASSWDACFPSNEVAADLARMPPSQPLKKSQRMAVKKWYKAVAERLSDKLRDCRVEAVMSTAVRARLIDLSLAVVQDHLDTFERVLRGREWSSHPQKWFPFTREALMDQIRKIF